jgi:hypothetical protein
MNRQKFTHEIEVNVTLPFLDVELKRLTNNKLSFKIFRKPTNTQRFIVNESHHSTRHKMVAFNSMLLRAVNVPISSEDQKAELEYINEAAKPNGYDKVLLHEPLKKHETLYNH